MVTTQLLLISLLSLIVQAQETVLGAYIVHRHGDRTPKEFPPAGLTDLGYAQIYGAGAFYRDRYLEDSSTNKIYGISQNVVKLSQLTVQAPVDTVLQTSAQGWLQGLYPPVGTSVATQMLANGTSVSAPMNGYQLIPVNTVSSARSSSANPEDTPWLQGSSGCNNAITSSNSYFISDDYTSTLDFTKDFYASLLPVVKTTFSSADDTYKNAYAIYDYIHVSKIHNSTIPSGDLLTDDVLHQLQTRANQHEFNLAYNSSEPVRAIVGSTLAAEIVQQLNATITSKSASSLGVQFGAYNSFLSFFGLAQLPSVSDDFTGIVDYASAMVFELVTSATVTESSYPSTDQISVRFLFTNGSAAYNPLTEYPLFGQSATSLPWNTFVSSMNKFAIGDKASWCSACGDTTGACAGTSTSTDSSNSSAAGSGSGGISKASAGVIGAMVTLAVLLGLATLVSLFGGLRVVSKKRLASAHIDREAVSPVSKE
ncbi:hypothetical protein VE00_10049 [Pseudogymnoascus sp. WSF 3629]|nr:hypothetical protein VE00_10042 [Pseudogymnoascus sp. WSF 3629]OBT39015.1 hypothetical protein VE00_10049 [Pseudogymnoascus sp. WSF 3629]